MDKNAGVTFICGRRGSGKTTLAKAEIGPACRVVVFDPIGEYQHEGFTVAQSLGDVLAAIKRGRAAGFRVAYQPGVKESLVAELHGLAMLLWEVQKPYFEGRDTRELTLLVDEMNLSYPNAIPNKLSGFTRLVLQGRHAGINLIGISQRPALVNTNFRDNATKTYVLPLGDHNSISTILSIIGRRNETRILELTPHHWLLWQDGRLSNGENKLKRKVK